MSSLVLFPPLSKETPDAEGVLATWFVSEGSTVVPDQLLAEVRSVVYRRSLPLATGNLPIVLSELGGTAGVIGAARLVSESVLSTA